MDGGVDFYDCGWVMNTIPWTEVHFKRLKELGADERLMAAVFETPAGRDTEFQKLEKRLAREQRRRLNDFIANRRRPRLLSLRDSLTRALIDQGFAQVETPSIISADDLERMDIGAGHPFRDQVYWVDPKRCLRPMLAPNLYRLMRALGRVCKGRLSLFEIGSCFRKEAGGARHASEFTMLNLVEMSVPVGQRQKRLRDLAALVMAAAGIDDYQAVEEVSEIYGPSIDIVAGGTEVASCALGPHRLDAAWGVLEPWVGLGFGLERLMMVAEGGSSLGRWCRNTAYVDGIRLNV